MVLSDFFTQIQASRISLMASQAWSHLVAPLSLLFGMAAGAVPPGGEEPPSNQKGRESNLIKPSQAILRLGLLYGRARLRRAVTRFPWKKSHSSNSEQRWKAQHVVPGVSLYRGGNTVPLSKLSRFSSLLIQPKPFIQMGRFRCPLR